MPSASRTIAAPAPRVWELLVDLEAWPRWGPSVADARLEGDRLDLGARGTVRTAVGVSLPFEVTEFDDGRRWAWKVAGIPATSHEVSAAAEGCEVTFGVPWWAPAYLTVCVLALRRIEKLATR